MKHTQTELAYMTAAVQNARPAGLVIILFDLLINDIRGAIAAIHTGNIEQRSAELKHGFLVLQQLEGSLDMENGGEAAKNFASFYAAVRASLFDAHMKVSKEILERQIELLLDVRQAWQQVESPSVTESAPTAPLPTRTPATSQDEDASATWI